MREKRKERNSSLELLRIIGMFMIISQHYVFHGGFDDDVFLSAAPNVTYLRIISMFGYAACSFFVLISGYYLIHADTGKGFYRRLIPLIAEQLFYSLTTCAFILISGIVSMSLKEILKCFFPFFYGNWFVVFYILLYLFIPYLNRFLLSLDKTVYRKMLLLVFVMFSVIPTFFGDIYKPGDLGFMFQTYLFGAYYGLYKEDFQYPNRYNLIFGLSCFIFIIASVFVMNGLGSLLNNVKFIKYNYFLMGSYSIPSFLFTLFIFMYASNKEFVNRGINLVASTLMGVYIIHDGNLRRVIWKIISPNVNYVESPYLHSILKILAVFAACVVIDLIRQMTLGKWVKRCVNKYYDRVTDRLASLVPKRIRGFFGK